MTSADEYIDTSAEWATRKAELTERFERFVDAREAGNALGAALIGAGAGSIIVSLLRRKRSVLGYAIGVFFVLAGALVLGGGAYGRRSQAISLARENVHRELEGLDPLARAEILREIAAETVAPLIHRHPGHEE